MLISAVVLMLPVILLSGMVFPIENMPEILQCHFQYRTGQMVHHRRERYHDKRHLGFGSVLQEIGVLALMVVVLVG